MNREYNTGGLKVRGVKLMASIPGRFHSWQRIFGLQGIIFISGRISSVRKNLHHPARLVMVRGRGNLYDFGIVSSSQTSTDCIDYLGMSPEEISRNPRNQTAKPLPLSPAGG